MLGRCPKGMERYVLVCAACKRIYADDGLRLHCDEAHEPALLQTRYSPGRIAIDERSVGLARFSSLLPRRYDPLPQVAYSATYRSKVLAQELGLDELWIAFSGYWPERGAYAPTATFKDVEAAAITARFAREKRIMVTASAGNTAAALALACHDAELPVRIVTPRRAFERLPLSRTLSRNVQFIVLEGDATYDDAIALSRALASDEPFAFEGGVWNVARRDGIGTIFLGAVEKIGRLPDSYIQGIGSGAGALAAYEASLRLIADGRFGQSLPQLMLVQNAPMSPVVDAWNARSPHLLASTDAKQRAATAGVAAPVLATSGPPYAVRGGLFDVLSASNGRTVAASNRDAHESMAQFERCEGIDIDAAAGVALAGLRAQVISGAIDPHSCVLLHVTGGGRSQLPGSQRFAPYIAATLQPAEMPLSEDGLRRLRENLHRHAQAA